MSDEAWDTRTARARAEAGAFAPLVGRWRGIGLEHGEAAQAELEAAWILDGSILEVRERSGAHEDRCYYRFDPEDGGLRVTHMMAGAWVREHPVERTEGGLVWVSPPGEPLVEWFFSADELRSEVVWPGAEGPDVTMTWTRS